MGSSTYRVTGKESALGAMLTAALKVPFASTRLIWSATEVNKNAHAVTVSSIVASEEYRGRNFFYWTSHAIFMRKKTDGAFAKKNV